MITRISLVFRRRYAERQKGEECTCVVCPSLAAWTLMAGESGQKLLPDDGDEKRGKCGCETPSSRILMPALTTLMLSLHVYVSQGRGIRMCCSTDEREDEGRRRDQHQVMQLLFTRDSPVDADTSDASLFLSSFPRAWTACLRLRAPVLTSLTSCPLLRLPTLPSMPSPPSLARLSVSTGNSRLRPHCSRLFADPSD